MDYVLIVVTISYYYKINKEIDPIFTLHFITEMMYSSGASHGAHHKKSSLKNPSSQHQMLLNPNGLPSNHNQSHYDESSRVYHITP